MKSTIGAIGLAAAMTIGVSLAMAHGGATGVVKERMELMENIGESMKTLADMFKGVRAYDAETVRAAAASIRDHAGARMTDLFPEGSLKHPTEALPTVWEDWAELSALAERLAAYSDALVEAAGNPRGPAATDETDPAVLAAMPPDAAFMQTARVCRACHGKFRAKQD